jgi:thiamine biosynthesis lipoprotein
MTLLGEVGQAASRFVADSEINRVNARAGRPVPVSQTLRWLIAGALDGAALSGGALDPTIGADLVRLGYDRDISQLATVQRGSAGGAAGAPVPAIPTGTGVRHSWRDVGFDRDRGIITVPLGVALDLGATAKAQTADRAAAQIARRYSCSVLVEIGGDLAVAGPVDDWQIVVAESEGDPGQQITLHNGGVATSTTTIRRWSSAGTTAHHIVDPRTGSSADGPWRTATVAADSAWLANVGSTAALVLGADASRWLASQQLTVRLVDQSGAVSVANGWPQPAGGPA